jgi:hypothetical protein
VVILANQHTKRLPDSTNVCLVVALGSEVLREGKRILRCEEALRRLDKRELDNRPVGVGAVSQQ